jgi:tetratricopeptide (TPR) repeat protein
MTGFSNAREESLSAIMNYTIVVSKHGRHRLALHELEYVRSTNGLGPRYSITLLELLSQRYRSLGDMDRARALADEAVKSADRLGSPVLQAHTYSDKAFIESEQRHFDEAIDLYKRAHSLFQRAGLPSGAAKTLQNLAQVYFDLGRVKAAKRALTAAERLAVKNDLQRPRAFVRILLGEIACEEANPERAVALWREAIDIAKELQDPILRFKAEFQLYKHAVRAGDKPSASSLRRLLRRRATWVPDTLEELVEFKKLTA